MHLLGSFNLLSGDAQRLFVHLYICKVCSLVEDVFVCLGPWFWMANISYPEISDPEKAILELHCRCWSCLHELALDWSSVLQEVSDFFEEHEAWDFNFKSSLLWG
ncbi:hypothetical protein IHE45_01G098500 [Dioscorea alata]|uniref:Uncharacterized protein n=1 Tax=Dioscorea alata TaxID=55571 RepID=A0ACB7WWL6_DIOAL|nr:hypothetical protein IHE45_01G098500 [Dioscorea alata]